MRTAPQPVTHLARIAPHSRLWGTPSACLPRRFPSISCSRCSEECPTGALNIGEAGFELESRCVDCGRCAAACPTGALSLGQFRLDLQLDLPGQAETAIVVDCLKVPESLVPAHAVRVPCTGALATSQWLALVNAANGHRVRILDRGWCTTCSAGGVARPAAPRVDQARALLHGIGDVSSSPLPASGEAPAFRDRIAFADAPLPQELRPDAIPQPGQQRAVSRRGFLRELIGQAARVADDANNITETIGEAPGTDGRARILPAERLAQLSELRRALVTIDETTGGARLPATLFHTVSTSQSCCNHQVCATACPTAALRGWSDGASSGIELVVDLCTGCGACAQTCPEQALRVVPAQTAPRPNQVTTVSHHVTSSCFDCGHPFVNRVSRQAIHRHGSQGDDGSHDECKDTREPMREYVRIEPDAAGLIDDEPVCPACMKSRELGRDLFAGLFSRPASLPP